MVAPDKSLIKASGYRISANADENIIGKCAAVVRSAYLEKLVSVQEIEESEPTDPIGEAWIALTYLCYCQDVEFGTRTGGEVKNFDYGTHVSEERQLKSICAEKLKPLYPLVDRSDTYDPCGCNSDRRVRRDLVNDLLGIYFKTQLFF